jgi:hypothetical protein
VNGELHDVTIGPIDSLDVVRRDKLPPLSGIEFMSIWHAITLIQLAGISKKREMEI